MGIIIRPFLSLLLVIGCIPCFSQVIDATICDSTNRFPITKYTNFLRTTTPITIDSVIKSEAGFTKASDEAVLVFNYDPYYYWVRIVVKNQQDKSRPLMLMMAPVGMYDGRLFAKNNGQWGQVAQAGLKYKFEERSYQFTHHVFPFTVAANTTDTLYVSIDASNAYKSFGFALIQPRELKIFENNIYFVFGIIVGLLLLFFVLNIALFFALSERLHLWYALYIAMVFLVVMKNDQLDQQFLGLDSEMAFRLTPYLAIGGFAIAILMHVVQCFLKSVLIHNRTLYFLAVALKLNVLCSSVVHAFVFLVVTNYHVQSVVFSWAKISVLLGICIIIINCIYCIAKGLKSALFVFLGSFVFMIGSVQRLFFPSTLSFLFPPTTFHIGIILETFIISMGLIYRYWSANEVHRQREEQIQAQTMIDISQEIHDKIGQELILAKVYLLNVFEEEKSLATRLEDPLNLVRVSIKNLRHLSRELKNESTVGIKELGIFEQVDYECQMLKKTGLFNVKFDRAGEGCKLEYRKQANLIRLIKAVLQNVINHSQASNVEVRLNYEAGKLHMAILDDGVGFDIANTDAKSNGLQNIKNRCFLLNATYSFESQVGRGTKFFAQIPV